MLTPQTPRRVVDQTRPSLLAIILMAMITLSGCRSLQPSTTIETDLVEDPLQNTLKWTTASELDNFGFDVYRSTSPDGPFERVTETPLPGALTTDEPNDYIWIDREIDPETAYFYYLESISINGDRELFSPIIEAPAKQSGVTPGGAP